MIQVQAFEEFTPCKIVDRWKGDAVILGKYESLDGKFVFGDDVTKVIIQRNVGPAKLFSVKLLRPLGDSHV